MSLVTLFGTFLKITGLTCLLIALPLFSEENAPPLEYWMADSAAFWQWDPEIFAQKAAPLGFVWMDVNQSSRAAPLQKPFFGEAVVEAVVRFDDGNPDSMMVSYFNRGDAEERLSEANFQKLVRTLIGEITSTLRVQSQPGNNKSKRSGIQDESRIWQRPKIKFELAYSYTSNPFRAEYVRLNAKKFTATEIPTYANTTVNHNEIKKNIVRDATSGDVYIDNIPMVDQGPKGYCAAATSERILRFFGQEVDQHQIAQIANTTSSGGTSSRELKSALQAVGRQYDFRLSTHIEWGFQDFLKTVERYNTSAKKSGLDQVELQETGVIMITDVYQSFDPNTYLEVRMGRRSGFNKFKEKVKKYVDAGCPLSWSVQLGMFAEAPPTSAGGHLRMIIGYNLRKNEIIYSDTWGRGHEKKSMPIDQAFAITNSLFSLEPKGLRL